MTTQTTTQAQATVGRPLSTKGRRARNTVLRVLNSAEQGVTARDIARQGKLSATAVRNRLNALERAGDVVRVGQRAQEGRGRPETLYVKA